MILITSKKLGLKSMLSINFKRKGSVIMENYFRFEFRVRFDVFKFTEQLPLDYYIGYFNVFVIYS